MQSTKWLGISVPCKPHRVGATVTKTLFVARNNILYRWQFVSGFSLTLFVIVWVNALHVLRRVSRNVTSLIDRGYGWLLRVTHWTSQCRVASLCRSRMVNELDSQIIILDCQNHTRACGFHLEWITSKGFPSTFHNSNTHMVINKIFWERIQGPEQKTLSRSRCRLTISFHCSSLYFCQVYCTLSWLAGTSANDGCPNIVTRGQWGARPPTSRSLLHSAVKYAFIHHGASAACHSEADCAAIVRGYQRYHMDGHRKLFLSVKSSTSNRRIWSCPLQEDATPLISHRGRGGYTNLHLAKSAASALDTRYKDFTRYKEIFWKK